MSKTLLSLFDYSGQWSAPFADAGWTVVQVDIKHGHDIKKFNAKWLIKSLLQGYPTINGILGAPPGLEPPTSPGSSSAAFLISAWRPGDEPRCQRQTNYSEWPNSWHSCTLLACWSARQ